VLPPHDKSRLLSIRLGGEEYEKLKEACITAGVRSLSEYSRAAIMQKVSSNLTESRNLTDDLTTLTNRLTELDAALQDISRQIARLLGGRTYSAGK
jgi:hypothetical protein